LYYNTTGANNTATGFDAMYSNTTGAYNTASGHDALMSNTTGASNTAAGYQALQSNISGGYNTADGSEAMHSNTTGHDNTATGFNTLAANNIGYDNTAYGNFALTNSQSGNNNIALGYYAGYYVLNSNNIHIGHKGTSTDSGTMRMGDPTYIAKTFIAGIRSITTGYNDAVPVLIDSNGQLGTISSSRRYKEDIQDMRDASSGLMRLRPVTFRYKKSFDDGSKPVQYGLIAEEVAEVYPDLVARSADGQIETVKYQVLDSMLLNELQKQNATIATLKEQIRAQEQQNRSLEERLAKVEAALDGTTITASR